MIGCAFCALSSYLKAGGAPRTHPVKNASWNSTAGLREREVNE
jgi:hypothetical protein